MNDKLKVVLDLIARTASDSEEEARTSALIACKMIREHGLQVVESGAVPPPSPPPKPAYSNQTHVSPDRQQPPPRPSSQSGGGQKPRVITLKQPGRCKTCDQPIPKGSNVWYVPNKGIAHTYCDYSSLHRD